MLRSFTTNCGGQVCLKDSEVLQLIKERLDSGNNAELVVTGNSMAPLFKDGLTHVTLEPFNGEMPKYGIALFVRANGTAVLHRCIGKRDGMPCFRGDNENYTEQALPSDIYGIAIQSVTDGKVRKLNGATNKVHGFNAVLLYNIKHTYRAIKRRLTRKK